MVTHKSETYDADGLEYTGAEDSEAFVGIAFKVGRDMRALDKNGRNDDDHAYERKPRCAGEFVDVAIEREWIRDANRAEGDDELTFG